MNDLAANSFEPNLVSTIIPVFNRPLLLRKAVESVLAQTHPSLEVIIADDGSTDDTPKVCEELAGLHPGVIQFVRKENSGPGPSREAGRQLARGEFIQYLDSDDLLWPKKFEHQIAALRNRPECGIAYGYTRRVHAGKPPVDKPGKWTGKDLDELFPGLLVDRWWYTHTPLYRRTVCDAIGSWSDLRWSQDWEYDARAGAMNVKLINCHQFVSDHCEHAGDRQTGLADWTQPNRLQNRVQLLKALLDNAAKAGVPESSSERQHFARWAFSIARQCAARGLKSETLTCLSLAETAAGVNGSGKSGVNTFRRLCSLLGMRGAGHLANWVKSFRQSNSQDTLVMASVERHSE